MEKYFCPLLLPQGAFTSDHRIYTPINMASGFIFRVSLPPFLRKHVQRMNLRKSSANCFVKKGSTGVMDITPSYIHSAQECAEWGSHLCTDRRSITHWAIDFLKLEIFHVSIKKYEGLLRKMRTWNLFHHLVTINFVQNLKGQAMETSGMSKITFYLGNQGPTIL